MATNYDTTNLAGEEWRPIVGFEGRYEVSNLGRIKSLHEKGKPNGRPLIIKLQTNGNGYTVAHVGRTRTVHIMVAEAFIGPRPVRPLGSARIEVNHIDGVKSNCRADNLEYLTQVGNAQHAKAHGLLRPPSGLRHGSVTRPERTARGDRSGARLHPERVPRGSTRSNAKLTESDIQAIRTALSAGISRYRLAKNYGLSTSTIRDIAKGRTWKHVG